MTGPSCDSQGTILDRVWLPLPHAGDRVLIGNVGAYINLLLGPQLLQRLSRPSSQVSDLTSRTACPGLRACHHGCLLLVKCVSVSMSSAL
jgi:hypothetical protein